MNVSEIFGNLDTRYASLRFVVMRARDRCKWPVLQVGIFGDDTSPVRDYAETTDACAD